MHAGKASQEQLGTLLAQWGAFATWEEPRRFSRQSSLSALFALVALRENRRGSGQVCETALLEVRNLGLELVDGDGQLGCLGALLLDDLGRRLGDEALVA